MKRLFTARQIVPAAGGKAPEWIMWMPGGRHEVSCGEVQTDGTVEPVTETVQVSAADATRLNAQLRRLLQANAVPFLDYDHAGGEASGWPQEFRWFEADHDVPAGIYVRVEWSERGGRLVAGRGYRYFSPEWVMDDKGRVHLPQSGPLGGLVNNPAFRAIRRIAKQQQFPGGESGPEGDGKDPSQQHEEEEEAEEMNKKLIAVLITGGLLKDEAEAALDNAGELVAQRLQARSAPEKLKPEEESETVKQLRAQLVQVQRGAARTFVASLQNAGKLPPKDDGAAKAWEDAYVRDAEGTEALAKSLRASAAMQDMGTGPGKAAPVETENADEEKLRARGARLQARALKLADGGAMSFEAAWAQAEAELAGEG